jgi:hypothetical protein
MQVQSVQHQYEVGQPVWIVGTHYAQDGRTTQTIAVPCQYKIEEVRAIISGDNPMVYYTLDLIVGEFPESDVFHTEPEASRAAAKQNTRKLQMFMEALSKHGFLTYVDPALGMTTVVYDPDPAKA